MSGYTYDVSAEDAAKAQAALDGPLSSTTVSPGVEQAVQAPPDTNKPYMPPAPPPSGDPEDRYQAMVAAKAAAAAGPTPGAVPPNMGNANAGAPPDASLGSNPPGASPAPQGAPSAPSGAAPTSKLDKIFEKDEKGQQEANKPLIDSIQQAQHDQEVARQTIQQGDAQSKILSAQRQEDIVKRDQLKAQAEAMAQQRVAFNEAQIQKQIAAIKEVDPDRRSIPAKILGAFAMAFGAFGSSITHAPNSAMEIIQEHIRNDTESQKANIEKQWKQINIQYKLNDDQRLHDEFTIQKHRESELTQLSLYDDAQKQIAAHSQNADAIQRSSGLSAAFEEKKTAVKQSMQNAMTNHLLTSYQTQQAQQAAAASAANAQRSRAVKLEDEANKSGAEVYKASIDKGDSEEVAKAHARAAVSGYTNNYHSAAPPGFAVEGGSGGRQSKEQKQLEQESNGVTTMGDRILKSGNPVMRSLPLIHGDLTGANGKDTAAVQDRDAYNAQVLGYVHSRLKVRSPELIEHASAPFKIGPHDNPETIKAKMDRLKEYLSNTPIFNDPASAPEDTTATSDIKAKKNIAPANDALAKFMEENARAMAILNSRK